MSSSKEKNDKSIKKHPKTKINIGKILVQHTKKKTTKKRTTKEIKEKREIKELKDNKNKTVKHHTVDKHKESWKKVFVGPSRWGKGLFAVSKIKKGEKVIEMTPNTIELKLGKPISNAIKILHQNLIECKCKIECECKFGENIKNIKPKEQKESSKKNIRLLLRSMNKYSKNQILNLDLMELILHAANLLIDSFIVYKRHILWDPWIDPKARCAPALWYCMNHSNNPNVVGHEIEIINPNNVLLTSLITNKHNIKITKQNNSYVTPNKKSKIIVWTARKDIDVGEEIYFHYGKPDPTWGDEPPFTLDFSSPYFVHNNK